MLYKKHLGYKGNTSDQDEKLDELKAIISDLQTRDLICVDGLYRFFPASGEGNDVVLYNTDGSEFKRLTFRRQNFGEGRCLSDYLAPRSSGFKDSVAMFIVTAGEGIREKADELKNEGKFLLSHALSALALETAEAFAEYLHKKIREQWNIKDDPALTPRDLFSGRYQGCRFSFGYPACPEMEHQTILFDALTPPDDFSVKLTEGYSMDPEASVSAIVFAHPEAKYFSVD
jgi:5-methyltetrahydrofolate--homocysteine methyltransferase